MLAAEAYKSTVEQPRGYYEDILPSTAEQIALGGIVTGYDRQPPVSHIAPATMSRREVETAGSPNSSLSKLRHEAAARADRLIQSIGAVALTEQISTKPVMSLYEALRILRDSPNDIQALALVRSNVAADVLERTYKEGHITKITQGINKHGQTEQHGQTAEQIQENSLRYASNNPHIRPRTVAETNNMYLLESLRREGWLHDHYAVVVSLCPDLDDQTLDELRFFSFSKSLALQATTEEDSIITTESAFVAGVKADGQTRYDMQNAVKFGRHFGEDWQGLSDTSIIQRVLLIPKAAMPNGVVDLVRLWDDLAGGTFFGRAVPRRQYVRYLQECKQRERGFDSMVQGIVDELIASAPSLSNPADAANTLHGLSEQHTLQRALTDTSIDPRVFGDRAALSLTEARFHYAMGNTAHVQIAMAHAARNAASGSCPSALLATGKTSPFNPDGTTKTPDQLQYELDDAGEKSTTIPPVLRCTKCRQTSPKEEVVQPDSWCCPKCHYKIDICTGEELHASSVDTVARTARLDLSAEVEKLLADIFAPTGQRLSNAE